MHSLAFSSSRQPDDVASPLMMVDRKDPGDSTRDASWPGREPRRYCSPAISDVLRKPDEARFSEGSGRYELAQRIADPDNPLTARVMVNRLWGHLIGKPLVDSPSDFGFRTQPPSVPQVLDELAVDFAKDLAASSGPPANRHHTNLSSVIGNERDHHDARSRESIDDASQSEATRF